MTRTARGRKVPTATLALKKLLIMKVFEGKVAIITGAAAGIGLGLARECARRGMHVIMTDINGAALEEAAARLRSATTAKRGAAPSGSIVSRRVDVTKLCEIEELAQFAMSRFKKVNLLFSNAGIIGPSSVLTSLEQWQHILDLNFMSVLHGVRVFLPLMRAQRDQEAHIVNTASITGVAHGSRPYGVTKAAVIALSEAAQQELMSAGVEHVTVSSLIPAEVRTRILGRRTAPFPHLRIPYRVPRGVNPIS